MGEWLVDPDGDLLALVYQYYPRGVGILDGDIDISLSMETPEQTRLVNARRTAATDERWQLMLRRLYERFPNRITNHSLHLYSGGCDGCYSFTLDFLEPVESIRWFQISFLAPYYITHRSNTVDIAKPTPEAFCVVVWGIRFFVKRSPFDPLVVSSPDKENAKPVTASVTYQAFDLLPYEKHDVEAIAAEIEAAEKAAATEAAQ